MQEAPSWIERVTAMSAAMAASASAVSASGPEHAAAHFQHGSTQFTHCHFTQSTAPPAQVPDKASLSADVGALSRLPLEAQRLHAERHLLTAKAGSRDGPEPAETESLQAAASNDAQPVSEDVPRAVSPKSRPAAPGSTLHRPLSREPKRAVRFKTAQSAAKRSSRIPGAVKSVCSTRPTHAPGNAHAEQPKRSAAHKPRLKDTTQGQKVAAVKGSAMPKQLTFNYAEALAALDSHGTSELHQLHSIGEPRQACA